MTFGKACRVTTPVIIGAKHWAWPPNGSGSSRMSPARIAA
ncbi:hypothetical protein L839_1921 [Mycobacterium avium MAV_120809_2495]|nr:hypothetical protein L839_1921 [Mycobacterium avium MAV_120809_2495]